MSTCFDVSAVMSPSPSGIDTYVLNGTKIIIAFDGSQTGNWTGRMIQEQGDECVVGITPSADAIIGKYYTNVAVIGYNGISRTQKDSGTDFYLLFNAWASSEWNLCGFLFVF